MILLRDYRYVLVLTAVQWINPHYFRLILLCWSNWDDENQERNMAMFLNFGYPAYFSFSRTHTHTHTHTLSPFLSLPNSHTLSLSLSLSLFLSPTRIS